MTLQNTKPPGNGGKRRRLSKVELLCVDIAPKSCSSQTSETENGQPTGPCSPDAALVRSAPESGAGVLVLIDPIDCCFSRVLYR